MEYESPHTDGVLQEAGLLSLPHEVLVYGIFPHLSLQDINALQRTCKELYKITQREQIWKNLLFVEQKGVTYKEIVKWVVETKKHVMELQRDLDREAHAKATWEKLQMRLLSEFNEERRINAELIGKSKVLEDEIAWLMGGHTKEREHLEVDLRNALQELSTLQRKIKSSEDESELKDKELKSYERRTSNLEAEVKELRKEVEELKQAKRELLKMNRGLRLEINRASKVASFPPRDAIRITTLKNKF